MPKTPLRRILGSVLLVVASTAGALLLAEWVIRLVVPQDVGSIVNIYVQDAALQYRYAANARARQKSPEFDVEIVTNSMGFRDDEYAATKPAGTCRIMVVGDSFSVGHGVAVERSYAARLERYLNDRSATSARARWEVINASVSGYHLYHYMRSIQEYARALDVDLVIVGFYVGNDFGAHDGSSRRIIRNGYLGRYERGLRDVAEPGIGARLRRSLAPAREWLATRSHLYVLFVRAAFPVLAKAGLVAGEYTVNFRRFALNPTAKMDAWYRATDPLLAATGAAAREAGAALLVVVIPDRFQVSDELWHRAVAAAGLPEDTLAADTPERRMREMLARRGIEGLDLLPELRTHQDREFYFRRDGHWNTNGHELAAELIFQRLAQGVGDGTAGLRCQAAPPAGRGSSS